MIKMRKRGLVGLLFLSPIICLIVIFAFQLFLFNIIDSVNVWNSLDNDGKIGLILIIGFFLITFTGFLILYMEFAGYMIEDQKKVKNTD